MPDEVKKEKPKRKSPEVAGPVTKREMTSVRDEVGVIRALVRRNTIEDGGEIEGRLDKLYTKLDRMDLRFKLHHDGEKKVSNA